MKEPRSSENIYKGLLDIFVPDMVQSNLWRYWRAILDPKLCADCLSCHGKIYAMEEVPDIEPPLHDHCRCAILPMEAIIPGSTTKDGENGADYWLTHYGQLPDYCISDGDLRVLGWKTEKRLKDMHRGKSIGVVYILTMMGICHLHRVAFERTYPFFIFPLFGKEIVCTGACRRI